MKKIALTSLLAVFVVSGAQAATNHFVGGSFSFSTDDSKDSMFEIAPEFGWKYNDKWDFGVSAYLYHEHDKGFYNEYEYGAGVFARYNLVQFGDFKVLVRGDAYLNFTTMNPNHADAETWTSMGLSVAPMVTYDISESFTLYAKLNFLGINAGYSFEHDGNIYPHDSYWHVGAFGDSSNVADFSDEGEFKIGFNYNF